MKNGGPEEVLCRKRQLIGEACSAFNRRDIDAALALMSENVSWSKASEGGRANGREEIRAYWTRQWQDFDPHVEPFVEIIEQDGGIAKVRVHPVAKSLNGQNLFDGEVLYVYTISENLIERMDIMEDERSLDSPTAAFVRQKEKL